RSSRSIPRQNNSEIVGILSKARDELNGELRALEEKHLRLLQVAYYPVIGRVPLIEGERAGSSGNASLVSRNPRISRAIVSPSVSRAKWPASSRWYSSVFRSRL